MARKIQEILVSDISGEELYEDDWDTIDFSYRGVDYRIDLSADEAEEFGEAIQVYLEHSQRVGGRRRGGRRGTPQAKTIKQPLDEIREWGRSNGYKVADRGRLSRDLVEAYEAAH